VTLLERELALKRTQAEQQISQVRKELNRTSEQVTQKIQKTKALLKPDTDRLDLALSMATAELKARRTVRSSLARSLSQLRKALKTGNPQWTEAERTRMQKESEDLVRDVQRIDHEIASLNEHVRLLKAKRLLLRL
jgi:hypothetical protein